MVFHNIPCSGILYCQLPFSALSIPPVRKGLHMCVAELASPHALRQ
jgi:hypothetical protein